MYVIEYRTKYIKTWRSSSFRDRVKAYQEYGDMVDDPATIEVKLRDDKKLIAGYLLRKDPKKDKNVDQILIQ